MFFKGNCMAICCCPPFASFAYQHLKTVISCFPVNIPLSAVKIFYFCLICLGRSRILPKKMSFSCFLAPIFVTKLISCGLTLYSIESPLYELWWEKIKGFSILIALAFQKRFDMLKGLLMGFFIKGFRQLLHPAIVLVAVIYYYSQPIGMTTWIKALLYCALAPTVLAGQINPVLFEALYASQHVIFLFSRIPQIWKNFSNKSTGELSFLTCFMNFGGSMVRVFTSVQEKAPSSVLLGSALSIATNGTILSQIALYQKRNEKKEKKTE